MAFAQATSTQPGPAVIGPYKLVTGTFTQTAGDVGGAITTGLSALVWADVLITSHIAASDPKKTISGGTITIVTSDGVSGNWIAIGR